MKTEKKHWGLKISGLILLVLSVAAFFAYNNINKLLTLALNNTFNSSIVSDVYELKFENLSVNFFERNIKVSDVVMQPLAKPVRSYPYINSSFKLTTKKLELENVNIMSLLKSGSLQLDRIIIDQPEIESYINGDVPIFFPLNDTTIAVDEGDKKKAIISFSLIEFKLINASIHATNTAAKREFNLKKLTISLNNLMIDQHSGMDVLAYKNVELSIERLEGTMHKEVVKHVSINDFILKIDSLHIQKTIDTLIYRFRDFSTGLSALDVQTADSIFHMAMGPFSISYKDKSIQLNNIVLKQNISNDAMQRRFRFQHTQFGVTAGKLSLSNVQFDSLIYSRKIFIDEVVADSISTTIYKDKTKPIDTKRFPKYFGEQIMSVQFPLLIKQLKATNVNLINTERKVDSSYAKVNINRGTLTVKNITNLSSKNLLVMNADAFIENKAHAYLSLGFDYTKPQFSMDGKVKSFNLPDINLLLQSYTPAKILKGTADEITFSGMIYRTNSTGMMKFLYHDLEIDLALKNQAKWKNSVISFAANTGVNSANPVSADQPARIVKFNAERDMNKGFLNIVIRSVLSGFKETMIMSKENRKAHQKAKKKFKLNQNR